MSIVSVLPYIQIILGVLLTIGILLQRSEASLGGAFGGDGWGGAAHARRGMEKTLFRATGILSILFILSIFAALIL